jgi:hypothetical protein
VLSLRSPVSVTRTGAAKEYSTEDSWGGLPPYILFWQFSYATLYRSLAARSDLDVVYAVIFTGDVRHQ